MSVVHQRDLSLMEVRRGQADLVNGARSEHPFLKGEKHLFSCFKGKTSKCLWIWWQVDKKVSL